MIFDEQKFSTLLGLIDLTNAKIKQIAYYMITFSPNAESVVNIWKNYFYYTKSEDDKIALIYLANETIEQTSKKKNEIYITCFGDIFLEIFEALSKSLDDLNCIRQLIQLMNHWEQRMFYSFNFMTKLKKLLTDKEKLLITDPTYQTQVTNTQVLLSKVLNDNIMKSYFELSIEEENIKKIYEKIDFEKANGIITSMEPQTQNIKNYVNDFEEKINGIREMLIADLCKRENHILRITEAVNKEKEIYFSIEENKKK